MAISQALKQATPLATVIEPIHDAYMAEPYDASKIALGAVAAAAIGKHFQLTYQLMSNAEAAENDVKTPLGVSTEQLQQKLATLDIDAETAGKVTTRMKQALEKEFGLGRSQSTGS
jgi:hypothetical protein